jgi:Dienelactone hydrolase family
MDRRRQARALRGTGRGPLRGVVSFHGGLETPRPAVAGQVNALAEEMTTAQADWQIISYGGTVHSFTNPDADRVGVPGIAYNRLADERSWKAMATFFEEIFGRV